MRKLNENELVMLGAVPANAILKVLDALYSGRFQHKPMSDSDTRRDLANFLEANLSGDWDSGIELSEAAR